MEDILKDKVKKRFADSNDETIEGLLKGKVAKQTFHATEAAMSVFGAFALENSIDIHELVTDPPEFDNFR